VKTEKREKIINKRTPGRPIRDVIRQVNLQRAVELGGSREDWDAFGYRCHSSTAYAYDDAHTHNIVALLRPALELQCVAPPPG
jgi:hypothetical protein